MSLKSPTETSKTPREIGRQIKKVDQTQNIERRTEFLPGTKNGRVTNGNWCLQKREARRAGDPLLPRGLLAMSAAIGMQLRLSGIAGQLAHSDSHLLCL